MRGMSREIIPRRPPKVAQKSPFNVEVVARSPRNEHQSTRLKGKGDVDEQAEEQYLSVMALLSAAAGTQMRQLCALPLTGS